MSVRVVAVAASIMLMPRTGSAQTATIEDRLPVAPAGRLEGTPITTVVVVGSRIGSVPEAR